MARKNRADVAEEAAEAAPPEPSSNGQAPPEPDSEPERNRPVHEVRLGRVKVALWRNTNEMGTYYTVTHGRLYKRDDTGEWHTASNYGRDDIPALIKALELCWLQIYGLQQSNGDTPF